MARTEIVPFADEHLGDAARLLAARHARHRAAEPLLADRFEDDSEASSELERVWRVEDASGAAALRGGRMVGYLVGAPRSNPVWGANTWVEAPGHAVEEAETVRDLYAAAAARWVDEGRPRHAVLVPAHDGELLEAWWRLSFGQQHAHGVRELGFPTMITDWRVTNLLSSRFWPKRGFRPTFLRLYRSIP
jgi:hypothetical protein